MDCDCHPHQTARTGQRSQLKNTTLVLSIDCCFCESSCNFRFSEASSTSSSSLSRSFLSPHPSALFQPFLFWAVGKMDPYFWKLFVVALCLKKKSSPHLPLLLKLQTQKHSPSLSLCDGWMEASVCALWTSESHRHWLGQYRPDRDRYIAVISVCFSVSELMSSIDDSRVAARRLLAAGRLLWSACPDLHLEDKPQTHHSLSSQA